MEGEVVGGRGGFDSGRRGRERQEISIIVKIPCLIDDETFRHSTVRGDYSVIDCNRSNF